MHWAKALIKITVLVLLFIATSGTPGRQRAPAERGLIVSSSDREAGSANPNELTIESLNIRAPVVYAEEQDERVYQKALRSGVVHYPGTAMPGEDGNAYIFGHSSDYPWAKGAYKNIFASLPKIRIGEEVKISNQAGTVYVYIVRESFSASASDTYLLSQDRSKKTLTLQTSYPVGTSLKRWIVIADIKL
jgi:LPXTG-site transpeptidase (sortase) family protein